MSWEYKHTPEPECEQPWALWFTQLHLYASHGFTQSLICGLAPPEHQHAHGHSCCAAFRQALGHGSSDGWEAPLSNQHSSAMTGKGPPGSFKNSLNFQPDKRGEPQKFWWSKKNLQQIFFDNSDRKQHRPNMPNCVFHSQDDRGLQWG